MAVDLRTPEGRLKWARECAGYASAKAFRDRFKISAGTYGCHESGSRGISPDVADKYAGYLKNCSPEWILYGHGEAPRAIDFSPGSPLPAGSITSESRRKQEEEAFALIYNGLLQLTQENDETILREFGVFLERYGFEGNLKGIGKLAFHLFREAQEEGGASALMERAVQRVAWFQDAMDDLKASLRKMSRLIED